MTVPESGVFCVDCDQPATHHRPTDDPDVVELVCNRHTMSDTPRPFAEMRDHGLLWLINRTVFHPRGYALALHVDDDGTTVIGWSMLGDGTEPWNYVESVDEDESFHAVESFLASLRTR
jgi:hypothetical protein